MTPGNGLGQIAADQQSHVSGSSGTDKHIHLPFDSKSNLSANAPSNISGPPPPKRGRGRPKKQKPEDENNVKHRRQGMKAIAFWVTK